MRNIFTKCGLILLIPLLSACPFDREYIHHSTDISIIKSENESLKQQKAIHLDASQRLVAFDEDGYCAEPSPDTALSIFSKLSLAINAAPDKAQGSSLLASSAIINSLVNDRSNAVTLLRDAMYRACEAHARDAITDGHFQFLLQRQQNLSTAMLAIESLKDIAEVTKVNSNSNIVHNETTNLQLLNEELKDMNSKNTDAESKNKITRLTEYIDIITGNSNNAEYNKLNAIADEANMLSSDTALMNMDNIKQTLKDIRTSLNSLSHYESFTRTSDSISHDYIIAVSRNIESIFKNAIDINNYADPRCAEIVVNLLLELKEEKKIELRGYMLKNIDGLRNKNSILLTSSCSIFSPVINKAYIDDLKRNFKKYFFRIIPTKSTENKNEQVKLNNASEEFNYSPHLLNFDLQDNFKAPNNLLYLIKNQDKNSTADRLSEILKELGLPKEISNTKKLEEQDKNYLFNQYQGHIKHGSKEEFDNFIQGIEDLNLNLNKLQ